MWKIQIFIFVEAVFVNISSDHHFINRFFQICCLDGSLFAPFVLLFWQTKSEFSINRAECALVFYRDAESFCDCSHFICGGLWFIDCLPLYV